MLKKPNTRITGFASIVITYFLTATIATILWFTLTKEVLLKLQSVSIDRRQGYDNPFLSFLAISFGFLLVAFIVYGILVAMLSKVSSSIWLKILLGIFSGLFPVVCIQLMTFGISLSDPGMLTEVLVMGMAGGFLPVVQNLTNHCLVL